MSKQASLKALVAIIDAQLAPAGELSQSQRTRARILREATLLFQKEGYRRASVDEVARRAHVAKGTVYVHFKNKAELLFAAVLEEKKQLMGPFRQLLIEDLTPAERLRRYVETLFLSLAKAPLSSKLMSGDREMFLFLEDLPEEHRALMFKQQDFGLHVLLEGVGHFDRLSPKERDARSQALLGLIYSAQSIMDARARGPLSPEEYARQLSKVIVEGIGAR